MAAHHEKDEELKNDVDERGHVDPGINTAFSGNHFIVEGRCCVAGGMMWQRYLAKKYPPAARRAGQQGTVTLSFTIGSSGTVISARIAESSGYTLLDNAALSAIRSWRFKPARNALGEAISYSYTLPVPFRLR
ncbi:energy transducer TonB [bacterium]|nr:energy transducer TonB [bacterium]